MPQKQIPATIKNIKLIIGLGNPGEEYKKAYHNAGFLLVDYLIEKNLFWDKRQMTKSKNFAFVKFENIIFAKSLVYMNESGKAIAEAIKYFSAKSESASDGKLKPEQIAVAHDDVDIKIGDYKISFDKNSAGHKGVESIIKTLKTKHFWRIRIGVGKESGILKKRKVRAGNYVLKKISGKDSALIESAFGKISSTKSFFSPVSHR